MTGVGAGTALPGDAAVPLGHWGDLQKGLGGVPEHSLPWGVQGRIIPVLLLCPSPTVNPGKRSPEEETLHPRVAQFGPL